MKLDDVIIERCMEAAETAAAYTRDDNIYAGLIIELAIIPTGIEVRGVMTHTGQVLNHMSLRIDWVRLSLAKERNPLSSAVLVIANELSGKDK